MESEDAMNFIAYMSAIIDAEVEPGKNNNKS